jgi:LacI family transcriptional regulator
MREITLHDVCREAGVSLATADRVANGRQGVREETAERVRGAMAKLGYRANPFAARLARKLTLQLCFVLPTGDNRFMIELAEQARRAAEFLAIQRIYIDIRQVDVFDLQTLSGELQKLAGGYQGVAVVALDHPVIRAAINKLSDSGVRVVTLVSDVPGSKRIGYVGIDNVAAGRTAGALLGRFCGARAGSIGVVMGSSDLRDHAERVLGLTQVIAREHPHLSVLPAQFGRDDDERTHAVVAQFLASHEDLIGLYSVGAGNSGAARALKESGRADSVVFIAHELGAESRELLIDGTIDAIINQDPGHEVRSAARILVAHLTGEPVMPEQERIRIEVFLRDNLP